MPFHRAGSTWIADAPLPLPGFVALGKIARVGNELRVLIVDRATSIVHEWAGRGAVWSEVGTGYNLAALGLESLDGTYVINLAPDGIRAILLGTRLGAPRSEMLYLDRPDVDARFGLARPISLPDVYDAYITEDCTRVYYSGLDRLFYSPRSICGAKLGKDVRAPARTG